MKSLIERVKRLEKIVKPEAVEPIESARARIVAKMQAAVNGKMEPIGSKPLTGLALRISEKLEKLAGAL